MLKWSTVHRWLTPDWRRHELGDDASIDGTFFPSIGLASVRPYLDQLYQMTSVPDQRVVIQGVDWGFYEQLVDAIRGGQYPCGLRWERSGDHVSQPVSRWHQETIGSFRGADG